MLIKILAKTALIILAVLILLTSCLFIFSSDSYMPDESAKLAMETAERHGRYFIFDGGGNVGLVFYPGAKVDCTAYAPLMHELCDRGISCVLVDMPFNLKILGTGLWVDAVKLCPNIDSWFIAGHSMGGAMAALSADEDVFSGIVLLASYSTKMIHLPSLTIYGSEDGVLNMKSYIANLTHLTNNTELVIDGGNHALFGSYGEQSGDGMARIDGKTQQSIAADAILSFISSIS